jgi:sec-independent protein translocase protein TatA
VNQRQLYTLQEELSIGRGVEIALRLWYNSHEVFFQRRDRMFGLGMPEMVVILVLALLVFGAGKLPEVGGAIGKGIRSFKKAVSEDEKLPRAPKDGAADEKKA